MIFRTDLAKEAREIDENIKGVTGKDFTFEGVSGTEIVISDSVAAEKLGKKKGRYVSFETEAVLNRNVEEYLSVSKAIGQKNVIGYTKKQNGACSGAWKRKNDGGFHWP